MKRSLAGPTTRVCAVSWVLREAAAKGRLTTNSADPTVVTAPTVAIAAPTDGSVVSGYINITGTASDDEAIVVVEVRIDDPRAVDRDGDPPALDRHLLGDGRRRVVFADTMKMSTYLVAFVIGPLELTRPIDVDNTPLRVAFVPGKVAAMDDNIGRLLQSLRELKLEENTFVVFLSDNGACWEWDPLGFDVTSSPKNILHTGEDLKKVGGPDSYISYGSGWANACNTPWRLYKHYDYEGGIATPCIGAQRASVARNSVAVHSSRQR